MQSLACQTTEQARCRSTCHLPGHDKSQWGCRQIGNNGGLALRGTDRLALPRYPQPCAMHLGSRMLNNLPRQAPVVPQHTDWCTEPDSDRQTPPFPRGGLPSFFLLLRGGGFSFLSLIFISQCYSCLAKELECERKVHCNRWKHLILNKSSKMMCWAKTKTKILYVWLPFQGKFKQTKNPSILPQSIWWRSRHHCADHQTPLWCKGKHSRPPPLPNIRGAHFIRHSLKTAGPGSNATVRITDKVASPMVLAMASLDQTMPVALLTPTLVSTFVTNPPWLPAATGNNLQGNGGQSSARRPDYVMVPRVMRAETVWLSTSLPGRSWWTAPLCWLSLPAKFHSKLHIMAGVMEPRHDLSTST